MQPAPAEAFPGFFEAAPRIVLHDPLADFLGAACEGVLEYRYADVVRLAGHSCPTVASAFLMARAALAALYGDALPERGAVCVELRDPGTEGVTGVVANVLSCSTGATVDTGFQGPRRPLRPPAAAGLRCADRRAGALHAHGQRRRRHGARAAWSACPSDRAWASDAALRDGLGGREEQALFRELWQARVRQVRWNTRTTGSDASRGANGLVPSPSGGRLGWGTRVLNFGGALTSAPRAPTPTLPGGGGSISPERHRHRRMVARAASLRGVRSMPRATRGRIVRSPGCGSMRRPRFFW